MKIIIYNFSEYYISRLSYCYTPSPQPLAYETQHASTHALDGVVVIKLHEHESGEEVSVASEESGRRRWYKWRSSLWLRGGGWKESGNVHRY